MKTIRRLWSDSQFDHYFFGLLVAVELLMSFTFLGYIHIPPISITLAYLPILVAGCLFGPVHSTLLGAVFGIASMYKASASYVMPSDAAFSPILSGSPIGSILLGMGTRMLFGLIVGMAYSATRKSRRQPLWIGFISLIAPKVHSLLVYSAMGMIFPQLGYRYYSALRLELDDVAFALVCVIMIEILWKIYRSDTIQTMRSYVDQSANNPYSSQKMYWFFAMFALFILCMAICAALYFSERESYMLRQHNITVSDRISGDLLHLQIQFLTATLSLNIISVILLILTYKYMSYKEYIGELDELTGIMGRKMFLFYCEKAQKAVGADTGRTGWFLFVDADYFKSINDTFGHAAGDKVLRTIALNLQNALGDAGAVGRIGGDEFAVIIDTPLPRQELEQRLDEFLQAISGALPDRKVSCSIGAYQFTFPQNVTRLLTETDHVLYRAKENGRACYVLQPCNMDNL